MPAAVAAPEAGTARTATAALTRTRRRRRSCCSSSVGEPALPRRLLAGRPPAARGVSPRGLMTGLIRRVKQQEGEL